MALEHISAAWKARLDVGDADERFYIDPRGARYPQLPGNDIQYNDSRSDYNFSGAKSAFIGTSNYPSSGLVAHYTMDNVSGATLTDDFGSNDGTITGAVQVAGVPGLGKALRFDGVDDAVTVPSFPAVSTGAESYSFWARRASRDTVDTILSDGTSSNTIGFRFILFSSGTDRLTVQYSTGVTVAYAGFPSVNTIGVWTHYVVVFDYTAAEVTLYVDGVFNSTVSVVTPQAPPSRTIHIGQYDSLYHQFDGDIDDVRIYNRTLTETEIEFLYNVRTNALADIVPDYLVEMPDKFTLRLVIRPWFEYTETSFIRFLEWFDSVGSRFFVLWSPIEDTIFCQWEDTGFARIISSSQFDDGASFTDLNQWLTIDLAIDLTTGTNAGSQLWVNRVSQDTTWSANSNVKVSNFSRLSFGHEAGARNAQTEYAYVMLIPDYVATDADIQNDYRDVKNEMIVWDFNGNGVGRTRCNVTHDILNYTASYSVEESSSGSAGANSMSLTLDSQDGAYNDDVYSTFAPEGTAAGRYNGTIAQKYLQTRAGVFAETWYGGDMEPFFTGRVDASLFSRSSQAGGVTTVSITADDSIADIATTVTTEGRQWEDYNISDTDEDNSLIHAYARVGSQRKVRNYASDSGFEDPTITTVWTAGGSAAIARDTAEELLGTACAEIDCTGGAGNIFSTILFTGDEKLNVGEAYTFQVLVKCSTAATVTVDLEEHDSGGQNDETTEDVTIDAAQDYYELAYVTHTITDIDSDRLVIRVNVTSGDVVYADAVILSQGKRPIYWNVNNTATSGDADDYAEGAYDTIGFYVEPMVDFTDENGILTTDTFTVPWAVLKPGVSPWTPLKLLANASAATYIGCDPSGCFVFRTPLGGWGDPENSGALSDALVGGVDTSIEALGANKIIVRGVRYVKYTEEQVIWGGTASSIFGTNIRQIIQNGTEFPKLDTYGRFFANLMDAEESANKRNVDFIKGL